jgi:peptide/nickel transport system permease protein
MIVLFLILLSVALADLLAPYDPNAIDLKNLLQGPSADHLLGTDKTGRDIFSRILFGGRTSLLGALGVIAISVVIGVPTGLLSGYHGGKVDAMLMRVCDIVISFPALLLAFVFVASFGRGLSNAVLALGIIYVPMLAKLTRSLVMVERNKTYVEAAKSIGYSDAQIIFRQILPNCVSTILVQLTLDLGYAILDLAAMSFLGLGVQPPTADWGVMLEEGRIYLTTYPLMALAPGFIIIAVVVSLNIFSDGVQAYLDPSQRKLPSIQKFKKKVGLAIHDYFVVDSEDESGIDERTGSCPRRPRHQSRYCSRRNSRNCR